MNRHGANVLLLGESEKGSTYLLQRLEQRGCHCWFADSVEQGLALLSKHEFHLVLCTGRVQQTSPMMALLGRVSCSVFYSYPVEDGCWWLPLANPDQKCPGVPALRPSEFVSMLDQMVREIESKDVATTVAAGG